MDMTGALDAINQFGENLEQSFSGTIPQAGQTGNGWLWLAAIVGFLVIGRVMTAIFTGAISRGKGYAFFGNFLLGLLFGLGALIYAAGRAVSYEHECVMQDRLAMETAKEMYKLQRARERAQLGASRKQEEA